VRLPTAPRSPRVQRARHLDGFRAGHRTSVVCRLASLPPHEMDIGAATGAL